MYKIILNSGFTMFYIFTGNRILKSFVFLGDSKLRKRLKETKQDKKKGILI